MDTNALLRGLLGVGLGLGLAACADEPAGPPVPGLPSVMLPLHELSGLVWWNGELVAVSDAEATLGILEPGAGAGHALTLPLPRHAAGPQLEGVTVDALGRLWMIEEEPGAIYVMRVADTSVGPVELLHTFQLDVPSGDPLASAWAADANARGEGIALLGGGHVLVAKQRRPVRLVEFGPAGEAARGLPAGALPVEDGALPAASATTLVPLAEWTPAADGVTAGLVDISDLASANGELWVLGGRSHLLATLVRPLVPTATTFALAGAKTLPAPIGGLLFEGCAIDEAGTIYLGVDRQRMDQNVTEFAPGSL